MKSNYKKLGGYIRQVNIRNIDLEVNLLLGVSVSKKFIPSIANTVGADMQRYKIVKRGQFTYIADTSRRGDKMGLAMLEDETEAIVSQAYTVFEIIDHNQLLPEYLMMWFRRPEFDRYARYKSHGSVREIFDWEEMCDIELPIPSIEKQREIVKEYNVIVDRIKLNEGLNQKLEEAAQAIYKQWFVEKRWSMTELKNLVDVKRGGSPRPIQDYIAESGLNWLKISDATASVSPYIFEIKEKIKESGLRKTVFLKQGELVLSNSASPGIPKFLLIDSCIHDGWLYFSNSKLSKYFLYLLFKEIRMKLVQQGNGSVFTNLKTDILKKFEVPAVDNKTLEEFDEKIVKIFENILNLAKKIQSLQKLKSLLLARIAGNF